MLENLHPSFQALLGTLFTWGLTAFGAGVVFFLPQAQVYDFYWEMITDRAYLTFLTVNLWTTLVLVIFQSMEACRLLLIDWKFINMAYKTFSRSILDASLGFAGGVMTAASFWSLLAPAIEMSSSYGDDGQFAFFPVACGFLVGALFVFAADIFMTKFNIHSVKDTLDSCHYDKEDNFPTEGSCSHRIVVATDMDLNMLKQRKPMTVHNSYDSQDKYPNNPYYYSSHDQWKRIFLLIIAITVHNIPEGLAVGVGFGAIGKTPLATFQKAKSLAIGIGIQNFPEGMAVSLPLRGAGYSLISAFWWGQLSGMVEPVFGVLGAVGVGFFEPLLPYALSFAAGAMIFVVVDDIIPESHAAGNGKLASIWYMVGFITMMVLDVALGGRQ